MQDESLLLIRRRTHTHTHTHTERERERERESFIALCHTRLVASAAACVIVNRNRALAARQLNAILTD